MEFGIDHKVKIETLNEIEAHAFLLFLRVEESRHIQLVERLIKEAENSSNKSPIDIALKQFEESSIWRHMDDIDDIKIIRAKIKIRFGWRNEY